MEIARPDMVPGAGVTLTTHFEALRKEGEAVREWCMQAADNKECFPSSTGFNVKLDVTNPHLEAYCERRTARKWVAMKAV